MTRSSGFVLVAILLIVALLSLLMVVSSMLSQIERKAAANSSDIEMARANALFALDTALNQLQSQAGPDQRITARAEILDSTPATAAVTEVNQPYWTGVWRTGDAKPDVGASSQRTVSLGAANPTAAQKDQKAVWLVSGISPVSPLTFNGTLQGNSRDAVVLASNYGPSPSDIVVPLVPLLAGSQTTGAYAYWVSDEGVKAKVNISDPTLGVNPATDPSGMQAHFFAPQASAGQKAVTAFNGNDLRADTGLPKVTTLKSLSNLTGLSAFTGTSVAQSQPDITTVGFGVLADVRRGGLKKDLTAGLEDPTAFGTLMTNYGFGANSVYRSASSANLTVPTVDTGVTPVADGLLWHNLFFHYNSYKGTMPAPVTTSGTSPVAPNSSGNPATLPQVQTPRVYDLSVGGTAVKVGSLTPIPIAYRVDVALSSYNKGTAAAPEWRLRLHYYPQLVLWNPYGVQINATDYQFQRNVSAFSGAGSYSTTTTPTLPCIRITINAGLPGSVQIPYFKVNQVNKAAAGRLTLKTKLGDSAILEPGETRVFALDNDASKGTAEGAITFSDLVSNPNMSADYSQYCDVLTDVETDSTGNFFGNSKGATFSTPSATATVDVTLSERRLRCQNADTFILSANRKWPHNDGTVRYMQGGAWEFAAAASAWPTLQIQQLSGTPRRIIGFYVRQKGLLPSAGTNTYNNAASQIPPFMGNSGSINPMDDNFSFAWQEVYLSPLGTTYQNGQTDVQIAPAGNYWETSFGEGSAGVSAPTTRVVLRDVPNQPMVSLGQFMHMPAGYINSTGIYQAMTMGAMFVGGSYASPIMDTSTNALTIALGTTGGSPNSKLFFDDSFLANEALFDRFFLSTVPPQNLSAAGTIYPDTWIKFNAANLGANVTDSSKPFLNSRLKPYYKNNIPPKTADLRAVEKAAANLLLDGAFNVNSTSIPAWKAFLASITGNDLRLWNATQKSAILVSPGTGTPFSRFWSGSGRTAANQAWSGLRVLSDDELTELATRIVEQVKLRGPFLSMADFLNRRLGPANSLTRSGALQAAIDSTSPDINAAMKTIGTTVNAATSDNLDANGNKRVPDMIPANMKDSTGNTWNTAIGIPGYLMQQDLVQALAPAMSARSDAFLVRIYGEVRNRVTGKIEGRAWGEATVQRFPDYVDQTDQALTAGSNLGDATPPSTTNLTNQAFGRRFKVIGFRWLNDNEV